MLIFQSSKEDLKRWIERTEVRLNILRLCARRSYTLPELSQVSLREVPRLELSHYGELSEINATVAIGECKKRELLVKVGERPSRATVGGYIEVLRTTLFAFLMSPRLALLEPEAYTAYITNWLSQPWARERFLSSLEGLSEGEAERLYRLQRELFLTFPGYLHSSFASFAERPGLEKAELGGATAAERQRIFGQYYLAGIITAEEAKRPPRIGFPKLLRLARQRIRLDRPRLDEGAPAPLSRGQRLKVKLLLTMARWPASSPQEHLSVAPIEGATLLAERLGPIFAL